MSFILEALKKVERQHAQANSRLTHTHQVGFQSKQRWPWLVTLVITAGAMLSVGILLGRSGPTENIEAEKQSQAVVPVEAVPASAPKKYMDEKLIFSSPPEVTQSAAEPKPEPLSAKVLPDEQMSDAVAPITEKPPSKPKPQLKPQTVEPVQTPRQEIDVNTLSGVPPHLPDMHIDIHSINQENPAKSYALINMERYHINDRLNNGLVVIDIVKEGVVMEYQGEKFLLRL